MIFPDALPTPTAARQRIENAHRVDEATCLPPLIEQATFSEEDKSKIAMDARILVEGVRAARRPAGGIDIFLQEYGLSTAEGVTLMCLAESLLRVPDNETADALIRDKIGGADWARHLGQSESLFVNASTWALMLTGAVIEFDREAPDQIEVFLRQLVRRTGEPVVREALRHAMRIIGRQFVLGRTIEEALSESQGDEAAGYRYSFDMLGEGARTMADAERYYDAYRHAIATVGATRGDRDLLEAPGISVKLSALHPRYEFAQRDRVLRELVPRLVDLCCAAKDTGISVCIDAEEADRLTLFMDVFAEVAGNPALRGWDGLGLALQAYQKRAFSMIDWLGELAASTGRQLMVRLVKGAYWDTEIKRAQQGGYLDYPVFTRKEATDVSYIACARKLLEYPSLFYPQFATHNAHTVVAVAALASSGQPFEYQRLHGMGAALHDQLLARGNVACRVYAPVGGHEQLLAYLVRRLLENGANTSFVNRIADDALPIEKVIADPVARLTEHTVYANPRIPRPGEIFAPIRANSTGLDLNDPLALRDLRADFSKLTKGQVRRIASPVVCGKNIEGGKSAPITNPADRRIQVGSVFPSRDTDIETAIAAASRAAPAWDALRATARAEILDKAGDLIHENQTELMDLCIQEAGKTLPDAVAEIREAVDFCRYYASQSRLNFADEIELPGPTGEQNRLRWQGRGVFACISPWNFPLAIFMGQITAALAAGNAVIAKPAEQIPLIAARAVALLHAAGVPVDALHLLPGEGSKIGGILVADARVSGIAFTGSLATAQIINRGLAARPGAIVPLIAETGGQNTMIVDSSALLEQVVDDAISSAFQSAGQRCSALRCLFVQEDIADRLIELLVGRTRELEMGDPAWLATDVGPVIDEDAKSRLDAHVVRMAAAAELLFEANTDDTHRHGTFFAPRIYLIDGIERLPEEVFGPVLHVVRYARADFDSVVKSINDLGYGLTFGVHSRVDRTIAELCARVHAGNSYVNRNIIGAVVGVQPFGGEGLSGTGPKAGGPHYLQRFAVERSVSVDTTAAGGNAALLGLGAGGEP